MPVWKWAALVENWAWASFDEKHHGELGQELRRDVDFQWMNTGQTEGSGRLANPLRWQENKQGESLLSVHRRRDKAGE